MVAAHAELTMEIYPSFRDKCQADNTVPGAHFMNPYCEGQTSAYESTYQHSMPSEGLLTQRIPTTDGSLHQNSAYQQHQGWSVGCEETYYQGYGQYAAYAEGCDTMAPFYLQEQTTTPPCSFSLGHDGKRKRRRVISAEQRHAANVRERRRMFHLNEAFDQLRKRIPTFAYEKKLSRIETLKLAVTYIQFMADIVEKKDKRHGAEKTPKTTEPPPKKLCTDDNTSDLENTEDVCGDADDSACCNSIHDDRDEDEISCGQNADDSGCCVERDMEGTDVQVFGDVSATADYSHSLPNEAYLNSDDERDSACCSSESDSDTESETGDNPSPGTALRLA